MNTFYPSGVTIVSLLLVIIIMSPNNPNTEIALLKQETQYIKEAVNRVEKNTTEWMARLEKKQDEQHKLLYEMMKWIADTFPNKFVTKEEIEPIKAKQIEHDKIIERIAWWSIGTLVTIILWIAWITKYM